MNRPLVKFAGFLTLVVLVVITLTQSGCNKNEKCRAVVTCLDATGSPIPGADIVLSSNDVTLPPATTDASGTANFESDLPMILDISVNGNPTGRVARLEEGQTDNVTVQ